MNARKRIALNLAAALLAGAWGPVSLRRQAAGYLGPTSVKLQWALIDELLEQVAIGHPPSPRRLTDLLMRCEHFDAAVAPIGETAQGIPPVLESALFAPSPRYSRIDVPRLATSRDLAGWLGLDISQLDWLADARRQHKTTAIPILQHYRHIFSSKRCGPPRLIEAPKPRLKSVQRQILRGILDMVPVHDCVHGFVARRSCITSAQIHAGEAMVVGLDLKDFFPSTPIRRINGLFRSLGYPWTVACLLTGLCSTSTPGSVFMRLPEARRQDWSIRQMYQARHLPQGAPTSPATANLAARQLDVRLCGLAKKFGANFSRYADDLAFSGDQGFARKIKPFLAAVETIVREEGYGLNAKKTRIMGRGGRQRITGLVVNDHVNVSRADYDRLKAILHNCVKNGPSAENRDKLADFRAHLDGRVVWLENVNPARGERLRRQFNAIRW